MGDPWGIVLVPTEAGEALLAIGRSLAIVPGWDVVVTRTWCPPHIIRNNGPDALPIWWAGELVPEGLDRLHRVMAHEHWSRTPSASGALQMARQAAHEGLCRVVVLDLLDGRIVERGQ